MPYRNGGENKGLLDGVSGTKLLLFCVFAAQLHKWQVTALCSSLCGLVRAVKDCVRWLPRYFRSMLWQCFPSHNFRISLLVHKDLLAAAFWQGSGNSIKTHDRQILCSESEVCWEDAVLKAPPQDGEGDLCENVVSSVRFRAWWGPSPARTLGESVGQLLVLVKSQEKGGCCLLPPPWASSSF